MALLTLKGDYRFLGRQWVPWLYHRFSVRLIYWGIVKISQVAGFAMYLVDVPSSTLRKKRFKIGDRVTTSHGTGTVVEIDGEKYLVDLDGQSAQLWTKDWALRKA